MNGVNIIKVTSAVDFLKPQVGLIPFVIDNWLILLPSMYILSKVMLHKIYYQSYWKADKSENDKEHANKTLIHKVLQKFN